MSGVVKSLQWDFGDGNFSDTAVTSHRYNVAGNFTISLKVTNSFGCAQLISRPGYIKVLEGVKADFSVQAGLTCNPPAVVDFKDLSKGAKINEYLWDFGDGTIDNNRNPRHVYTAQGVYPVTLVVKNSDGCGDTLKKSNAINIGSVKASFTSPATICQNNIVSFSNTSLPAPASVTWNFGDGTSSTEISPKKSFDNPGVYTVLLTSNFGGCTNTVSRLITVLKSPSANFNNSILVSTCKDPITLNFLSTGTDIKSYQWNFGDGATSTEANPKHTYYTAGRFTVSLLVTGATVANKKLKKVTWFTLAHRQFKT